MSSPLDPANPRFAQVVGKLFYGLAAWKLVVENDVEQ
jgi:hypothetical protein